MDAIDIVVGHIAVNRWIFWDGVAEFTGGKFVGDSVGHVCGHTVGIAGHCVGWLVANSGDAGVVGCGGIINLVNGSVGMVGGVAVGGGFHALSAVGLVGVGIVGFWVIVCAAWNAGAVVGAGIDVTDAALSTGKTRCGGVSGECVGCGAGLGNSGTNRAAYLGV